MHTNALSPCSSVSVFIIPFCVCVQNHLEQRGTGVRKVVFLVNQLALAQQQYEECAKYLSDFRVKLVTGSAGGATPTEKVPLKHLLMR